LYYKITRKIQKIIKVYDNILNRIKYIIIMANDYLMNIASILFLICYIPEFYANYRNKNANIYNVFEKVVMISGTGFALGYSLSTNSPALRFNYSTLFFLDTISLFIRIYYAYKNRNYDVRIIHHINNDTNIIHNPIQNPNENPIQKKNHIELSIEDSMQDL